MMIIKTTYAELESELAKWENNEEYLDIPSYDIQQELDDDLITTTGPVFVLTDRNVAVVEGVYCNYDVDTKEYVPDWSLTLVYELTDADGTIDMNNYSYYEQDPPMTTLHNYFHSRKIV